MRYLSEDGKSSLRQRWS